MKLKILFITWYFPPSNTIAAVRLGKLAKHLCDRGHRLQILTAKDPPYPQSLPCDVDEAIVERVRWRDVNGPANWGRDRLLGLLGLLRRRPPSATAASPDADQAAAPSAVAEGPAPRPLGQRLSQLYTLALNFPDSRVGWIPAAWPRGVKLAKALRPDGIFASGPPFTTLLLGYLVSRWTGAPLVVEFRDRWSEDPYYPPPPWRQRMNRWLENRITRHAVGITTVSEPWAQRFRERFSLPVAVIYNGYDAEDFAGLSGKGHVGEEKLRILYTGGIYAGYRDPTPLFQAIAASALLRDTVEVLFYGSDRALVLDLAQACGAADNVQVFDRVTHAEALNLQSGADLLLLMQWDNPKEQGNVPGKFAEYLGARRPILVLGYAQGVPATFVRERSAGIASTDPRTLTAELERLVHEKRATGMLPRLSDTAVAGFSRAEQSAKLETFLAECFARS